jgi:large subunit ribosomal protein L23
MLDRSLITRLWITEKTVLASAKGKYTFLVKPNATKNEIKKLVKELYKVDPIDITIVNRPSKTKGFGRLKGQTGTIKKATVTLKAGQTIAIS